MEGAFDSLSICLHQIYLAPACQ